MNNRTGLIAIILAIILAFLLIGYYAGTSSQPSGPGGPVSAASSTQPGIADWVTVSRPDAGFSIAHPADLAATDGSAGAIRQNWRLGDEATGTAALLVSVPKSFQPGTNFSEARLTVGYSDDPKAVSACLSADPSLGPVATSTTATIDGIPFTVVRSNDVGAGNLYETTSYRAPHAGKCYAVEYTIHWTQLGNYPPEAGITEFDKATVTSLMERMVNTFKFLPA